jgi:hypothetical protein
LNNKAEPTEMRMKAAGMIMDRGIGKPNQMVKVGGVIGTYDLTKLTDEQLQFVYGTLRLASTGVGDTD